jgi:hypothetical protein
MGIQTSTQLKIELTKSDAIKREETCSQIRREAISQLRKWKSGKLKEQIR